VAVVAGGAAADETTEATTFGTDGIASQSLGTHYGEIGFSRLDARADGGLVAQQKNGRVVSFLSDGAPDPGVPPINVATGGGVFPVAGGKSLVLKGRELTRINADGSVDTGFGNGGSVKVSSGSRVAELPSGKIVVVSIEVIGPRTLTYYADVRVLNQSGGDAGPRYSRSLPPGYAFGVHEIALTPDGGALVVGGTFLLELRPDGSANPGFGKEGVVTETPNVVGAGVLPDGSVEAVGSGTFDENEDLALLRLSAAGAPDPSFGSAGIRHFDLGGSESAQSASFAADGSVIVGGQAEAPGPCVGDECEEVPILVAFDPAGNLQTSFGQGGVLRLSAFAGLPLGYRSSGVTALARRPDGSIVAAGNAPPNETNGFLVAFTAAGALIPSFGQGGIAPAREALPATQEDVGFVPQPDGTLLAGATSDVGGTEHPVLIRYGADGSLDPSFGKGAGYVNVAETRPATGFAVGDEEAIIGTYDYPQSSLHMVRTGDGSPVTSFGEAGTVVLPNEVQIGSLAFAPGGDPVLLAIHRIPGNPLPGAVFRFRPDGTRDPAFGHDGKVPLLTPAGGKVKARALVPVAGGKFLVGGRSGRSFAITRLLPDGRSDPHFGSHGWAVVPAGGPAKSMTLSRAGSHIYLAGLVGKREDQDLVVMRLDQDGHVEMSFGRNGRRIAPLAHKAQPLKVLPTRRGVLVVLSAGLRPLVAFGRDGKVSERPVGTSPQYVEDVRAAVADGHLVVGWNGYVRSLGHQIHYLRRLPLAG
jgi:uncharacterized delta-60 repeat protein